LKKENNLNYGATKEKAYNELIRKDESKFLIKMLDKLAKESEWSFEELDFEIYREGQDLDYNIVTGISKDLIGETKMIEDVEDFEEIHGKVYDFIKDWIQKTEEMVKGGQ
jgi:hypothetical protein